MHPFESVLVYASLEDEAFIAVDQAASLARQSGAPLTLVRVLDGAGRMQRWAQRGIDTALRRVIEESQRQLLEERAGALRDAGLDVRVEVRWGSPWLELIQCVLQDGHDLVVKTAEGAARGRGLFFGSTALHLVRKCSCPVWVVGSADEAPDRRVLAAIDPAEGETRSAIARRILNLAVSMAGEKGEVHAVAAWRAEGESLLRSRVRPDEMAAYTRAARDGARASLDRALATAGNPAKPEHVHLVKGEPRDVLPALIEREAYDLVVLGSLGRVGIAGLLIGETAETLIRSVRSSILVVKPPGFVSPVERRDDADG
ncbi:MAG: universal stress protein [Proteobacteria bacterium]|nr:universal stress protein [Pseudomonadota bacterium]